MQVAFRDTGDIIVISLAANTVMVHVPRILDIATTVQQNLHMDCFVIKCVAQLVI